jgi:hypothetical protein
MIAGGGEFIRLRPTYDPGCPYCGNRGTREARMVGNFPEEDQWYAVWEYKDPINNESGAFFYEMHIICAESQ